MAKPNSPLKFSCGIEMPNRFMLAPLTNRQSHVNGQLSDDEYKWLVLRAKGKFGMVMTCASHVQKIGKGFPGQLGIFSDKLNPGHQRLVKGIHAEGMLAVIQLHHAGMRSPKDLLDDEPVCPSDHLDPDARGLNLEEVYQLRKDFIAAAKRAQICGYDGVEVHGAHGYILTQFLSSEINKRNDQYGGTLENRARLLFEIVDGIRRACGDSFLLGVRLSPEKFGMDIDEIKTICQRFIKEDKIDFLDISLWDSFKEPEEDKYKGKTLLEHFTEFDCGNVRLTVAGNIRNGADVAKVLNTGVDFVSIGKSGILHHDFPIKVMNDPDFMSIETPVSEKYLEKEGLSPVFIEYMRRWPNFVEDL